MESSFRVQQHVLIEVKNKDVLDFKGVLGEGGGELEVKN